MRHNINQISYLIGQFNNLIKTFGQKPEQVEFFKTQSQGLVDIGQISQSDLDFTYKVLGMVNTSNVKWSITMPRLEMFTEAMNYMVSCSIDTQRGRCLIQLLKSDRIDNTTAELVDEIYDNRLLGGDFSIDDVKSSKFGTFGVIGKYNKVNQDSAQRRVSNKKPAKAPSKSRKPEDMVSTLIVCRNNAVKNGKSVPLEVLNEISSDGFNYDVIDVLLNDVNSSTPRYIRFKNYEAACSCDPRYHLVDIREIVGLSMKYPSAYKTSLLKALHNGEFVIVEKSSTFSDYLGVKESTSNWMDVDTESLKEVIGLLLDTNIAISK